MRVSLLTTNMAGSLQGSKWSKAWTLVVFFSTISYITAQRVYDMDEFATCTGSKTLIVDDKGLILNGRGDTAPPNPPLTCIVYLLSTYRENDGTNKLQMEVLRFTSRGCEVTVNVYNGRGASGQYLQSLGCDNNQVSQTGIFYSTTNELTVRMTRNDRNVFNEYDFQLLFKPWKDPNALPTLKRVDSLSVAAIIGIVIGCLVIIAVIILFCWCCCTGRLSSLNLSGRIRGRPYSGTEITNEKSGSKPGILNLDDPQVWNTVTTGRYEPGRNSERAQNRQPGNVILGRRFERNGGQYERNGGQFNRDNRQSGHYYEPYDEDAYQGQRVYQNQKSQRRSPSPEVRREKKETMIDDVFDSESNKGSEKTVDTDVDDATLQTRKHDTEVPEAETLPRGSPQLERYLSMDLTSQPDQDTISSPLHINAGVRASVDDELGTPSGSLRKKNKEGKSPKMKRKDDEKSSDFPMAPPPEAFEPIFTKPISGIDYQGSNRNLYNQPAGFPGGFIPYGFVPTAAFAPGTQTYAYAYQTVPHQGAPGQQGAWFVQNTPTTDGNRRTAYAVQETIGPDKRGNSTPDRKRRKNSDPSRRGGQRGGKDSVPDMSIIARGAAPPNPGQGHRSIEMKSGTDPNTNVHTTQVLWTDNVPDPTDPKPDENPQITRKTITRVTTKSGHGELPQHATLLALDEADPAFLSPGSKGHAHPPAILPSAASPANENLAFYTGASAGDSHRQVLPERSSTPTHSVHNAPTFNSAIRDRIPFDSTV